MDSSHRPTAVTSRRGWARFDGRQTTFAVEACTGWRYVVEELRRAGITAQLAEPADTAAARGRKRRAKTDRSDSKLLRELTAAVCTQVASCLSVAELLAVIGAVTMRSSASCLMYADVLPRSAVGQGSWSRRSPTTDMRFGSQPAGESFARLLVTAPRCHR